MKATLGILRILLKFGMPAVLLLVPLLAVYGWLSPWPPGVDSLARYAGQVPVLVGMSHHSRHSNQSYEARSSRSYILFPTVLSDPKVVTVIQEDCGPVTMDESASAIWCSRRTANPELVVKSAVISTCLGVPIVAVDVLSDSSLQLTFENGVAIRLPTDMPVVDWHWAITDAGGDPYVGCHVACFAPGDIQWRMPNASA